MKRLTILLAAALLLPSCLNKIDMEFEDTDVKIVLNAQLSAADQLHKIYLNSSTISDVYPMKGASVRVYVNGAKAADAEEMEGESWWPTHYQFNAKLNPGDEVRVEASKSGETASASMTVPQAVQMAAVDTSRLTLRSFDSSEEYFLFKIALQDPEGPNYYRLHCVKEETLQIYREGEEAPEVNQYVESVKLDTSLDPILSEGVSTSPGEDITAFFTVDNTYAVFSDELFSGEKQTLRAAISAYWLTSDSWQYLDVEEGKAPWDYMYVQIRLRLFLESIDFMQYRYLKALNNMETFGYSQVVIIEPTTLPSNVEGGIGFLAVSTPSAPFTFDFPVRRYTPGIYTDPDQPDFPEEG